MAQTIELSNSPCQHTLTLLLKKPLNYECLLLKEIQKVAMKNFFLAIFVATIICLPILGMNYPLEEGNNFMGAMLSIQFITLLYVLTIKFDNEKKD